MEPIKSDLTGRRVRIIGNAFCPGLRESYTQGEKGIILKEFTEWFLIKLDNTQRYARPYRYIRQEFELLP